MRIPFCSSSSMRIFWLHHCLPGRVMEGKNSEGNVNALLMTEFSCYLLLVWLRAAFILRYYHYELINLLLHIVASGIWM